MLNDVNMNCIEIQVGNNVYKLRNENYSQSESYTDSDWAIVWGFITKGVLPKGWVDLSGLDSKSVFDKILNDIKNSADSTIIKSSEEDIINNLIGNNSFNNISDLYNDLPLERNVLVIKSVSNSNWYGINENRIVLITSDSGWSHNRYNRIVYDVYNALKNNDENIIKKINDLYSKFYSNDIDIYKKLMVLVNVHALDFSNVFFKPFNSNVKYSKSKFVKDFKKYKGLYTVLSRAKGKEKYFIFSNIGETENDIEGILIDNETNTVEKSNIKLSDVKTIYTPYKFGEHSLYHNVWMNSKMTRVDDITADNLYKNFLHINDDEYNIIDLNSIEFKYDDSTIDMLNSASGDILLHTNDGVYEKKDGKFILYNGKKISKHTRIHKISISKNDTETFAKISNMLNEGPKFNVQNLRLYVYEKFGKDVKIYTNFKRDSYIRVQANDTIDKKYTVVINYGNGGFRFDHDFYTNLLLAVEFAKYANEDNIANTFEQSVSKEYSNVHKMFKQYCSGMLDDIPDVYLNMFKKVLHQGSLFNESELSDIIESNKNTIINSFNDEDVNELIKQLIDLGLYIYSCDI